MRVYDAQKGKFYLNDQQSVPLFYKEYTHETYSIDVKSMSFSPICMNSVVPL